MNSINLINIPLSQRNVLAICAALTVLVCGTLTFAIWQWHQDWMLAHTNLPTQQVTAKSDQMVEMIAAIPDEHLFGKAFSGLGEAPITNLQLRVTGIVKVETEQNGNYSKAYISIAGQPSKIYQVGDSLPYGVKVYEITPNAVILENDGRIEKLPLPRESLKFKPKQLEESL